MSKCSNRFASKSVVRSNAAKLGAVREKKMSRAKRRRDISYPMLLLAQGGRVRHLHIKSMVRKRVGVRSLPVELFLRELEELAPSLSLPVCRRHRFFFFLHTCGRAKEIAKNHQNF